MYSFLESAWFQSSNDIRNSCFTACSVLVEQDEEIFLHSMSHTVFNKDLMDRPQGNNLLASSTACTNCCSVHVHYTTCNAD